MIYLIVDTNNWIYLASSKNPDTGTFEEGHHIKLYDTLISKIEEHEIELLVCKIVVDEWQRNKGNAEEFIQKLENEKNGYKGVIEKIGKTLEVDDRAQLKVLFEMYQARVQEKISNNIDHIEKVEALIKNSTEYTISAEIKVFVTDWALSKKAPFKGDKKNSTADALIFFGATDYLKKIVVNTRRIGLGLREETDIFIFVSGNKGDFSNLAKPDEIHEDLKPIAEETGLIFYRSLPAALNFVEATIKARPPIFTDKELAEMEAEINDSSDYWYVCDICSPGEDNESSNLVYFNSPYEIEELNNSVSDPNQIELTFPDTAGTSPVEPIIVKIQTGDCSWCGTTHLRCSCDEVTAIDGENANGFVCDGCGIKYVVISEYMNGKAIRNKIVFDSRDDIDQ